MSPHGARLVPTGEGDLTFATEAPFALDGGGFLSPVTLHYAYYGEIAPARDNVVLVCHALSGSARIADWWGELLGPGQVIDTSRYCALGVNVIGSCYGSTGPRSTNPPTGRPYGGEFPVLSIADMVRAQAVLLDHLKVQRLRAVVGGSIGGMQALAWAHLFPDRVPLCVALGAAPLGAMALALGHLQRQAIVNDPGWQGGHYEAGQGPRAGLALARALATCSYKSAELFEGRFGRRADRRGDDPARNPGDRFDVGGYLDYQGGRFLERFDAACYLTISRAMETFDLDDEALRRIWARVLLIGIRSDWLFPPEDVRRLVERIRGLGGRANYAELDTVHGHDAFLAETHLVMPLIARALEEV
jgi:homoserine O-acetyltransferase